MMKLFIPRITWEGDFGSYFLKAFRVNNVDIQTNTSHVPSRSMLRFFKLTSITRIQEAERNRAIKKYGESVLNECLQFSPDVFLVNNESNLPPSVISEIKTKCKCLMAVLVNDDPWDSTRWKCGFPHSLKYFDYIFSADPVWNNNIRKVAPKAKLFWHFGGYDPDRFYPEDVASLTKEITSMLSCDLAFTGSSYGAKAEGAYRSDLLSYLCDFNLKIWGGDNWPHRFIYNPELEGKYKGNRLTFDHLRYLYSIARIMLNIPAPQICYGFQPRVFEIAACKGFQIADNRWLIRYLFNEDELVVFDTIMDLKEKVKYYLEKERERLIISENLHHRVSQHYTWEKWATRILDVLKYERGIKDLDLLLPRESDNALSDMLRNA